MPEEVIGLIACVGPIVAFVAWMAWLSRRPNRDCPQCGRKVALTETTCPACGADLGLSKPGPERDEGKDQPPRSAAAELPVESAPATAEPGATDSTGTDQAPDLPPSPRKKSKQRGKKRVQRR